jgi:glutamine amidotransferase
VLEARCDSALAWALVASRLRAGCGPADALAWVISAMDDHEITGRFNFLLTDGEVIAATAAGNSLCYRLSDGGVVVASEPGDEEPGWTEVPDRSVLTATPAGVEVSPLPGPPHEIPDPAEERTATS